MKIPIRTTVQQMQTAVQGDGTGLQGLGPSATDVESSAMSLYKEIFHQTPPFRLPPSHTGRTTGTLGPLCLWGWDVSWDREGVSFHLHHSSQFTNKSFLYSFKFTCSILWLLEIQSIKSTTIWGGRQPLCYLAWHLSINVTCNGGCETLVWSNSWEVTVMRVMRV